MKDKNMITSVTIKKINLFLNMLRINIFQSLEEKKIY